MSDEYAAILAKGAALFPGKRKCAHVDATLVQHLDDEYGWFACYQCDHCGQITRRDVTADELDIANNAPWLDVDMYGHATKERVQGETMGRALAFMAKASK